MKWGLPNLEAFAALHGSSSHLSTSEHKKSTDEHSLAMSEQESARQMGRTFGVVSDEVPFTVSNTESVVHVTETRPESGFLQQEFSCRLPAKLYEPTSNAALTNGLSPNVNIVGADETPADVMVEAALANMVEHDQPSLCTSEHQISTSAAPASADIRSPAGDRMSSISHERETWLEPSADVVYTADLLLGMGFYSRAYSIYCQHWEAAWPCDIRSAGQVALIASMSRAASTAAQLRELTNKMKLLIEWSGTDRRQKAILHTQLAILHLRLQQHSSAASDCELALWMIKHLDPWWECEPKDWRLVQNLLYQCAEQLPYGLRLSMSNEWLNWFHECRECFECHLPGPLGGELQCDQTLRKFFARCASQLLLPDLRLHLAEGLRAASGERLDLETTTRIFSVCLFRHLWDIFSPESSKFQWLGSREVMRWVDEISDTMQIGRADLFATIALALISLRLPLHHKGEQAGVEGSTASASSTQITFELLQEMHKAAIALVLEETPPSAFMRLFLKANATINLTRVEKQAVATESTNSLLGGCSHNNTTVRSPEVSSFGTPTCETMSHDPPLNPSPRSSTNSELRSMKSMQRHIADRKVDASTISEEHQEGVSRLSNESWSLRVRLGLSNRSYSTLSSRGSGSTRNTGMDWEPAVSGIQEVVVA